VVEESNCRPSGEPDMLSESPRLVSRRPAALELRVLPKKNPAHGGGLRSITKIIKEHVILGGGV